ncbi:hypothetical protein LJB42_001690 [Komagataella kurtzmanii]|nr:hypothetical protein LJB42_001690 [Komagataella kurtzmanii]
MLSSVELNKFNDEGCVVIENFLSKEQVSELVQEADRLLAQIDIKTHPLTKFSTAEDDDNHVGDKYFLESSDRIHYFFEVEAFDEDGKLTKPVEKAINKIGHGLHFLNEKYSAITINERISSIARQLKFHDPRVLQSMLILKQPEIGGKVPSHQDGEFLFTEPQSCIGFWFALEDCTVDNGCLSFIPGSHKVFPVEKRFVKDLKKGSGTKFVDPKTLEDWSLDTSSESYIQKNDESQFVKVEIPAGSLVLIHNSVVHKSEKNTSGKSRYAYTFHCIEGTAKYDELNWLQIPPNNPSGTSQITKLCT